MELLIRLCKKTVIGDYRPRLENHDVVEQNEEEEDEENEQEPTQPQGPDILFGLPLVETKVPTPPTPIMGQKPSNLWKKPNLSLTWALNNDITLLPNNKAALHNSQLSTIHKQCNIAREANRSISPSSTASTARPGRRRRVRKPRCRPEPKRFGYQIQDVDEFLTRASLDAPGNIPMVLSTSCVLYQTQAGCPQKEVSLPLGMVVNGVLKNRAWLYAQTPHGEEGYVPYACCLPLGILPPPSRPQPCWDTQTDIFPRPSGNRTDTEKMRDGTRSESGIKPSNQRRRLRRESGERSVDGLYLQASRNTPTRHTLLVIGSDYRSPGRSALSVSKGDVVNLISSHLKDWFWVRDREGKEGFIPAVVAGHGFL